MEVVSRDIPECVLTDIFSRLPAKSLLRFKLVNKYCLSLISSLLTQPSFISQHFLKANAISTTSSTPFIFRLPGVLLFRNLFQEDDPRDGRLSISSDEGYLSLPLTPDDGSTEFLSCFHCNGLLCLVGYRLGITLCNPELQEQWSLPMPSNNPTLQNFSFSVRTVLVGFGYDSSSGNYKIVRIFPRPGDEADVYAIRSKSSKKVKLPCEVRSLTELSSYAYCDGVCYWMMESPSRGLISFDFRDDEARYVKLPVHSSVSDDRKRKCSVMEWKGKLALMCYDRGDLQEETGKRWIKMWVMNNEEPGIWKEHILIDDLDGMEASVPLTFWRENELLMRDPCKKEFFSYDTVRRELRFVNTAGARKMEYLTTYLRSLVSLKEVCKLPPDFYMY